MEQTGMLDDAVRRGRRRRHRWLTVWLVVANVALVVALVALAVVTLDRPTPTPLPTADPSVGAVEACKGFVSTHLRAPSSARWVSITPTGLADGRWSVSGQVDAMNGLGGLNDLTFVCQTHTANGNWYDDGTTVNESS